MTTTSHLDGHARSSLAAGLVLAALAVALLPTRGAAADDGDDKRWWSCVDDCGEEDARCVDKCTDDYNSSHQLDTTMSVLKLRVAPVAAPITPNKFVSRCPRGTHLSPFDMPIYDARGLFVVGYKTVWFCLPDDLEPAG